MIGIITRRVISAFTAVVTAASAIFAVSFPAAFAAEDKTKRDLSVYYPNWVVYGDQKLQVKDLPWDRITTINHAFFLLEPNAELTEFSIVTSDDYSDMSPGGSFDQYTEMHELYPDVDVVLSIGGGGAKWFPQMTSTPEKRKSFIDSCLEYMGKYSFISGIDVDWEYPNASQKNQFTALIKEMRESFTANGYPDAIVSFCAQSGYNTAKWIDFPEIHQYIDRVNIMTYDMSGAWTKNALHHASLNPGEFTAATASASESAEFLISLGVPPEKINIGSPLFTHGWTVKNAENAKEALGKLGADDAFGTLGNGILYWHEIKQVEALPGTETGYDEESAAAYLYCNDPASGFYQMFYSYESDVSLQAKLDYINEMNLGGMIVWHAAGDRVDADFPMLTQMAVGLGIYEGAVPVYNAEPFKGGPAVPVAATEATTTVATTTVAATTTAATTTEAVTETSEAPANASASETEAVQAENNYWLFVVIGGVLVLAAAGFAVIRVVKKKK